MSCCCKQSKLRIATKNVFFGFGSANMASGTFPPNQTELLPSIELTQFAAAYNVILGLDPNSAPLNIPSSPLYENGSIVKQAITEETYAKSLQYVWLYLTEPTLNNTQSRLDAMAEELSAKNLDIIGLQECTRFVNNPYTDKNNDPRDSPFVANNFRVGDEDSPEEYRVYDFADMIVKRLRENHNQEFVILNRQIYATIQAPRTFTTLAESDAISSLSLSNVILVRKNIYKEVKFSNNQSSGQIHQAAVLRDAIFLAGDGTQLTGMTGSENSVTVKHSINLLTYRPIGVLDLKLRGGKSVRIVNCHFPSGNNEFKDITDIFRDVDAITSNPRASRALAATQILEEFVEPHPDPVFVVGDFNTEPLNDTGSYLGSVAFLTLLGSVNSSGTLDQEGGPMIDAIITKHGLVSKSANPEFNTSRLSKDGNLHDNTAIYRNRIDAVLYRRKDNVTVVDANVTQAAPFAQADPSTDFAWTSDHNGVFAEFIF